MKKSYVVGKGAAEDLKEILKYTIAQWGIEQSRVYISQLDNASELVASGKGTFKEMNDIYPSLRMVLSGKHYIFCLSQENAPSIILAILHERMDIIMRLKNRLTY